MTKCIQSSAITYANKTNVTSDDFKLAQTFKGYFESLGGKLGKKECEANSDVKVIERSKVGVNATIEKYKNHPSVKIINENVSFESHFNLKEI